MNLLIELVAFAVAIGVLVVVHEYGHYSVARLCGVKVLRFSIGFGKPLAQWVSKKTGTEWTVSALPLGGYVKMLDERETGEPIDEADLPHAFNRQPVGKRIAIVAAGPLANFLLAIVLFAVVYATGVSEPAPIVAAPPSHSAAAQAGFQGGETIVAVGSATGSDTEQVRSWSDLRWKLLAAAFDDDSRVVLSARDGDGTYDFPLDLSQLSSKDLDDDFMSRLGLEAGGGTLRVAGVEPGSAAQQAGLAAGDRLRSIDGRPVDSASAFIAYVKGHAGKPVRIEVERGSNGDVVPLTIVPAAQRDPDTGEQVGRIGAALATQVPSVDVRYGPLESVRLGAQRSWDIAAYSVRMFGRMLTGDASLRNLSGPVTIADYAGKSARLGPSAFLSFLALVSISLGVLNLLPIPVLDGGHLLYYLVEAVTGKAVSDRWQLILQRAGLACIVALSAIALFNDLARLIHF
ncbi:RIP metalloprotease RseP [Paraburkholderia caballeronis]|uniref:Zinc metalloprotease n=1 Tax=Paraburkholderia caballeronis TaxID=416943 RepID=A0A1H7NEM1_9BURK|nr:RIP metalloprotease RseP [Paraburkholderia caballeronis]PXW26156.1 site-2 protease [Paraburkholderia caballeronis]PXX01703.1 site-2 protease [Paraburkholderia caballeronis]RAK00860.1 site-2 protease [Paraburkholderia caballeronis]SEC11354.1 site-2 protease. Metallo peptidase. MEROPS family M50B [Paraburkholderia caballeronis]SEL21367.1 site-2 protease. Metallo peptidase. MEROPS family M50B [Paraburkholderia caballeronis]